MSDSESDRKLTDPNPGGVNLSHDRIDLRSTPEPELSEAEILQILFESPEDGWPIFWQTYSGSMIHKVRRFGLPPEDAADLLQEVSLKIIQEDCRLLRLWNSKRGCLKAYLSVIAQSVVLDFLRSPFHRYAAARAPRHETNGRPHKTDPTEIAGGGTNPRDWAEKREILQEISACLDKMAETLEMQPPFTMQEIGGEVAAKEPPRRFHPAMENAGGRSTSHHPISLRPVEKLVARVLPEPTSNGAEMGPKSRPSATNVKRS